MVDPTALAKRPPWMRERAARSPDAADGLEWCARCHLFDHIMDKSAPPAVAGVERGYNGAVDHVFDTVAAFLEERGDLLSDHGGD